MLALYSEMPTQDAVVPLLLLLCLFRSPQVTWRPGLAW
jgi:hypothetical protein